MVTLFTRLNSIKKFALISTLVIYNVRLNCLISYIILRSTVVCSNSAKLL